VTFARALTAGLSQNTVNLLAACMHLNPRLLVPRHDRPTAARYHRCGTYWPPPPPPDALCRQPLPVRQSYAVRITYLYQVQLVFFSFLKK